MNLIEMLQIISYVVNKQFCNNNIRMYRKIIYCISVTVENTNIFMYYFAV